MPEFRPQARVAVLLGIFAMTAMLYLGQAFLMPLAMSVLIAFLLNPCVARLEKWGLPHTPAVVVTALTAFLAIGVSIYVVAGQFAELIGELPHYRKTLVARAAAFRVGGNSPITQVADTMKEMKAEFAKEETKPLTGEPGPMPEAKPLQVEVVDEQTSALKIAGDLSSSLLGPLGTGALVAITVIFLMIDRRDLRDRFIHLVGRGQLRITTQAIDEAADRVSRYLFAQLIVNVSYGVPVGLGLYFIGIPNAALWGILAAVLRFIPYIGPWMAAIGPILLSLAIAPGWWPPVATIGLFVVLELISNNVVEPWLYGSSTGLSATAIIVSAAFWTWLWGAGGLLLATPLTVVLAVIGKYVPALSFLDVLLGDRPALAAEQRFYHRLLAGDETELFEIVEQYTERNEPGELFDEVIVPALRQAEEDCRTGTISREERGELFELVRDALDSIDQFAAAPAQTDGAVIIVPARTEGDYLAATMLAHLLTGSGLTTTVVSHQTLNSEVAAKLRSDEHRWLCVSALTPTAARAASVLVRRLLGSEPRPALLGLWGQKGHLSRGEMPNVEQVHSLRAAARSLRERAPFTPAPAGGEMVRAAGFEPATPAV